MKSYLEQQESSPNATLGDVLRAAAEMKAQEAKDEEAKDATDETKVAPSFCKKPKEGDGIQHLPLFFQDHAHEKKLFFNRFYAPVFHRHCKHYWERGCSAVKTCISADH